MNIAVYLNPNYIANDTLGESVTNISEFAKVALEVALQYKDNNEAKVTAVIVGADADEVILREAYAMGVDALILSNRDYDANNVSSVLSEGKFDAVVTAEDNAHDVAKALRFSMDEDGVVKKDTVLKVKGSEVKPRYMHITRVFNAYEQPIEYK